MPRAFEEYKDNYSTIKMARSKSGVLELTFHSHGDSLQWGRSTTNIEWPDAFTRIARDDENRVVIMIGTGELWSGPHITGPPAEKRLISEWDVRTGTSLMMTALGISVPVITCVNGPAYRHSMMPLLADVVLAAPEATFSDEHMVQGLVPGDGVMEIFAHLMGINRTRYFLIMNQELDAKVALDLGLIAEIVPRDQLLLRARTIADRLLEQSPTVLRHTRLLFTHQLKRICHETVGYGLALEGLGIEP